MGGGSLVQYVWHFNDLLLKMYIDIQNIYTAQKSIYVVEFRPEQWNGPRGEGKYMYNVYVILGVIFNFVSLNYVSFYNAGWGHGGRVC